MYSPLLSMYGTIISIIYYKDNTVTITFGLGGKPKPKFRHPLPLLENGKTVSRLDPIHNVRVLGDYCAWCPGIGEGNHNGDCLKNKTAWEKFMARKRQNLNPNHTGLADKPLRRKRAGLQERARSSVARSEAEE